MNKYAIHSLSPVFFYVVNATKYAEQHRLSGLKKHGRCRVSPVFATRKEAEKWMASSV
jgi:hypothetical protein